MIFYRTYNLWPHYKRRFVFAVLLIWVRVQILVFQQQKNSYKKMLRYQVGIFLKKDEPLFTIYRISSFNKVRQVNNLTPCLDFLIHRIKMIVFLVRSRTCSGSVRYCSVLRKKVLKGLSLNKGSTISYFLKILHCA